MNIVTAPKKASTAHFTWDDPLLLDEVLTEDERKQLMATVEETAKQLQKPEVTEKKVK